MRVIYQSTTTAVYIDRNWEFAGVEISLVPLVSETVPPYPYHFGLSILFNNLLEARAPQLLPIVSVIVGLKEQQLAASLAFYSHTLDEYAADVLQGDFSILPAVEEVIECRRRRYENES